MEEYFAQNALALVGNTPMLLANEFAATQGMTARLLLKLEGFNPAGSVKDRLAVALINHAEEQGWLKPGGTIVEPTSGNTGIGLAMVAAQKGYKLCLTMPDTMSVERQKLLRALGAQVVLTPGKQGMQGAIQRAKELVTALDAYMPGQFENPVGPQIHKKTTAQEIWQQTGGKVHAFVAGVGTGGTIAGVSAFLKEQNPGIFVAAVEPAESAVISGNPSGSHGIMGIGAGFIPTLYTPQTVDEVLPVFTQQAYEMARSLAKTQGVLVGISSGAALFAAVNIGKRPEFAGKTIVALMPDGGERYLSTPLFE